VAGLRFKGVAWSSRGKRWGPAMLITTTKLPYFVLRARQIGTDPERAFLHGPAPDVP
jgi:hypothetical protein